MWIVAYALRHPYTIAVLALLLLLLGAGAGRQMSTDILPVIDLPAVNVLWTYPGLSAEEMAAKVTSFSEISIMNNVDDIRSVESETANGFGMVRVEFQPQVRIEVALAQIASVSQTILRRMPAGMTPPLVVRYSAGSVPILQLALSSDSMTDAQLYDYARLSLRAHVQSIPGIRLSLPYGGAARQIMVDLDPERLQAYGLTPLDVSRAVTAQNLTLPSGTLREAGREPVVSLNASPVSAAAFNDLPLAAVDGRVIFLRDVAHVRDGGAVQANVARVDGGAGVFVSLLKLGDASTVDIVDAVMERLPAMRASAPPGVRIEPIFDQSRFVRAAMDGVLAEAALVACLVGAVVLLFLGSARSTAIVLTSIPLSLLAAVAGLYALGHTFNLMTLGGLGLAIGILVDNALVEIENINRNIALGKPVRRAVLDSARQVVFPEFVSTLCICIVFVPVFLLSGPTAFVFAPLALAVVIAMASSFLLSRTLVPTLAFLLLPAEVAARAQGGNRGWLQQVHGAAEHWLERRRDAHLGRLSALAARRGGVIALAALLAVGGIGVGAVGLGRDFFPVSDAGNIRLYLRAPAGTRVENTAALFAAVQREIRAVIPAAELQAIVENIGQPDPINATWVSSLATSAAEGELLIQLNPGHAPTQQYVRTIRALLARRFPELTAIFRPADIVGQTLNGTAAAAIEVRLSGRDAAANLALAQRLRERIAAEVPGAVDVALRQLTDWPEYRVEVDRARAAQLGVTQQDVANALLVSLSSSASVLPSYWSDGGISYTVAVQVPPLQVNSIDAVLNTPVRAATAQAPAVLLRSIASVRERTAPAVINRALLAPLYSVLVGVDGSDLGAVHARVAAIAAELETELKPGNRLSIHGQAAAMAAAYGELAGGLALAAVLVYLLLVVNFQSWNLPFTALGAMPLAIGGAALGLWVTGTPISVSALMGTIMVMGVSTANSVLVASFARQRMLAGAFPVTAALEAVAARFRPVLMTATAMLIGMVPMALALGEGGEQNAPLARAVIGGLLLATPATLTVVPLLVSLRRRPLFKPAEGAALAAAVD